MSNASSGPESPGHKDDAAPSKPRRSPVERMIVRGVIVVLLVLVLIEYRAYRGFAGSMSAIEKCQERYSEGIGSPKESELRSLIYGYSGEPEVEEPLEPNEFNAQRVEIYKYPSLLTNRRLYVYYGVKAEGKERELITATTQPAGKPPFENFNLPPEGWVARPPEEQAALDAAIAAQKETAESSGDESPKETPQEAPSEAAPESPATEKTP